MADVVGKPAAQRALPLPDEGTQEAPPRAPAWLLWGLVLLAALLLHLPLLRRPPRALTPTERSLAAVAQKALREGDGGLNYAGFFLHAEDAAGSDAERRWRQIAQNLREQFATPGTHQLDHDLGELLIALFRDANLGSYHREEARLSGFLAERGAGGNCEAQTKMLVASLRAARLPLPEGRELGVEVFQDHMQAVVVDRRRSTVSNILTGEMDLPPRTDVYRPAVLLSAYLRGLGLASPVSDTALRLVRGPRVQALHQGWSFFTTSTLRMPASAARYTTGHVPERADVPLRLPGRPSASLPAGEERAATWREEFLTSADPRQLFAMDGSGAPFMLIAPTLVFRQREHAEQYLRLTTDADRRAWLLSLVESKLREELAPGVPALPGIDTLASWSQDEMAARFERLRRLEQQVTLAESSIDRNRSGSLVASELELRQPALRQIRTSVRALTTEVAASPEEFLRTLGSLDHPRRHTLLAFLMPRMPSAQVRALAAALGDPSRVTLAAGERGAARSRSTPPEIFTDIELVDGNSPAQLLAPAEPPSGTSLRTDTPSPGTPPPSTQAVPLPEGAYLDLVMSGLFSSGEVTEALPILRRWTPGVSDHLLRTTPAACAEVQIQLQESALRPWKEAGQPPPAALLDGARRLERRCRP